MYTMYTAAYIRKGHASIPQSKKIYCLHPISPSGPSFLEFSYEWHQNFIVFLH
jgi:hypothetical protein